MRRSISLLLVVIISLRCSKVLGFSEKLSGESILYGLSSLTENITKNEGSKCFEDMKVLYKGVENKHLWALKVLDASGHPETGFIYGNNLWIGSRSHCMDISNKKPLEINHSKIKHVAPTPYDFPSYALKFVKIFLKHNNTLQQHTQLPFDFTIQVGLCVPQSCTNTDLFHLFNKYLTKNYLNVQEFYDLQMSVERVKTLEKDPSFWISTPKFIILMGTMGIILLLSIVGTTIDVKRHNKDKQFNMAIGQDLNSKMKEKNVSEVELVKISQESLKSKNSLILDVLRSFSVYSNVRALVNTNLPSDSIRCIHGIRFFGMLWVIMIHSVFFQADYVKDPPFAYRMSEDLSSQILSNSTYSVDTYLFLSGFLLAYLYYKSKRTSGGPVNYLRKLNEFCMMCFNRFVRLTPPYLFVIILTDVVFTYLRQTSSLESSEQPDVLCSKYWWRNVLYINNLYPRSEMCLSWSWYMSLDTQAFVISAILLIVSTFAFKFAASSLTVLILGSMLVTAYKSYSISYIPTMDEQLVHLDDIYDLPWNRIGPYLVGTATGYFLVEKLQYKLVLGKVMKAILWILFPLLNLWILFTLYTRQLSVEFSAVYMGISRTLWGIGLAWTLLACCTGNADRMNKFLSFPGWIPMSRLTFCAYLLNPLVTNSMFLGTEMGFDSSTSGYAITILGIAFATFFWAFVVSLFFESPFILITKILLRGISRTPSNVGNSNTQKS